MVKIITEIVFTRSSIREKHTREFYRIRLAENQYEHQQSTIVTIETTEGKLAIVESG